MRVVLRVIQRIGGFGIMLDAYSRLGAVPSIPVALAVQKILARCSYTFVQLSRKVFK